MELSQGASSVREYDTEFSRLLVYASYIRDDEWILMQMFLQGLRLSIRTQCRGSMYALRAELVELATSIEEDQCEQASSVVVPPVVVPSVDTPAVQPRRQQQQQHSRSSSSGKDGKPAKGQKRRFDEVSRGGQTGRGCFGCGSTEHRAVSCPKKEASWDANVCFHCREHIKPGHIKPMCPKLHRMAVTAVQPVAFQPVEAQSGARLAAVHLLGQIKLAPRVYGPAEVGQQGNAQITGISGRFRVPRSF